VALLLVLVVAVLGVIGLAPGVYDRYPRRVLITDAQLYRAPRWTRPCWMTAPRREEDLCVHVKGRVVWVQHHDPDGDGDRHLIVMVRLRPRIVKLAPGLGVRHLPKLGTRIDVVGWLMLGGSGHHEVDTMRLVPSGR
jgi:hypothetical protein